jgi:hypothetical protein
LVTNLVPHLSCAGRQCFTDLSLHSMALISEALHVEVLKGIVR